MPWPGVRPPARLQREVAGAGADEPLTVDLDATLIITHSDDKDGAGKTDATPDIREPSP